jgi:spermidine synthase
VVKFKDRPTYKIRQNLHYRFGRTGGNVREFRQAHIPLLLHKNPTSVLFLGLGTGMTAGGAIPHDTVQSIDAVELIPEVVDAVRMLAEFNHHVIDHPKTTIHTDDARHFLLANPKQFDVIVSDLFVPWESESGYLYTVEHYRVARERLKSDGLFCQWLPLYQMGSVEFESIANSFAKVFPNTTVWWGQISQRRPVIALIGRDEVIDVQSDRLQRDIESVNRNRNSVDPNIGSVKRLWEHYAGDWKPTSTTGLNTDEFPRVEFLTPLSNRNRKLLSGANFESYYQSVFRWLSDDGASRSGDELRSTERRRSRQRLILFGNDE